MPTASHMYEPVSTPPLPARQYAVIYADPPWSYTDKAHAGERGVVYKYPTMTPERLSALDVPFIAADDCALLLWSTAPQLDVAIWLMERWSFRYKTVAFTWVKRNRIAVGWHWGMGNWTRSNAEFVLLGIRGKPLRMDKGVHSVIDAPVQGHSRKPDEVRRRIERLFGDVPRIELFARDNPQGWDTWGVDVDNHDV